MSDTVTFLASLPPIMSAIRVGQDGMRVQFDIPESEMQEAEKLLGMRGKVLSVAIVVVNQENDQIRHDPRARRD